MSQTSDTVASDKNCYANCTTTTITTSNAPFKEVGLRHRIPWGESSNLNNEIPGLREVNDLLDDDDDTSCLAEEEDGMGCPLPSTPEDDRLLDCEVN